MATVAVLPVKTLTEAKSRLQMGLSPGERRALVEAMYCDVLIALRRSGRVDAVIVVSADTVAQQIAGGYGADVLSDVEHGHNRAARDGVQHAIGSGAERVLLVPGDCPALDPRELDALIDRPASPRSVLVVPDRHGTGTNALLLTPPDVMASSFGPDSCRRHVASAREQGIDAEVVEVPSLGLDVDTMEDLRALERALEETHGRAATTRGMLMQLLRSHTR